MFDSQGGEPVWSMIVIDSKRETEKVIVAAAGEVREIPLQRSIEAPADKLPNDDDFFSKNSIVPLFQLSEIVREQKFVPRLMVPDSVLVCRRMDHDKSSSILSARKFWGEMLDQISRVEIFLTGNERDNAVENDAREGGPQLSHEAFFSEFLNATIPMNAESIEVFPAKGIVKFKLRKENVAGATRLFALFFLPGKATILLKENGDAH